MKVWVVLGGFDYERDAVLSIHSSYDKAAISANYWTKQEFYDTVHIAEYNVDEEQI